MTSETLHPGSLQRGLKNRHIQLIALGGAIGTGLFLGSAGVLRSAGPSMILGYAIGGLIAFLIMRQLGEMIVEATGGTVLSMAVQQVRGTIGATLRVPGT